MDALAGRARTGDTRAPPMSVATTSSRSRRQRCSGVPHRRPRGNATHRAAAEVSVRIFASAVREKRRSIALRALIGRSSNRAENRFRGSFPERHSMDWRLACRRAPTVHAISLSQPRLARTQAACRPQGKESPWCVSFRDAVASIASTTRRSRRPRAGTADRRRIASPSGFKPRTEAKPATRAVAGRATVDGRHTRPSARVDRDARTAPTATRARSPSFARRRRLGRAESGASARADRRPSRGAPFLDCFSRLRAPTLIERDARILPTPLPTD